MQITSQFSLVMHQKKSFRRGCCDSSRIFMASGAKVQRLIFRDLGLLQHVAIIIFCEENETSLDILCINQIYSLFTTATAKHNLERVCDSLWQKTMCGQSVYKMHFIVSSPMLPTLPSSPRNLFHSAPAPVNHPSKPQPLSALHVSLSV